ncbi:YbaB/EbfC family nucleoid-associated protein [Catenuloplanes japonicus]|uniref:YbaB/EbfC family nucleoid-associated protein n=1 Tax=Catenuloplanes japonicus TaxID=33876 RepID=UPI0005278A78|nr:YbaB/EbfC family nucleoid-associated protein [Catenuloplanes japonicus]
MAAEIEYEGHGQALDGLVTVVAGQDGRLRRIALDPRLHRLGYDEMADAILRAVNAALEDAALGTRDELFTVAFTEALNRLGRPVG